MQTTLNSFVVKTTPNSFVEKTTLNSFVEKTTLDLLNDDICQPSTAVLLGVLGSSSASHWSSETLQTSILTPLLNELGAPAKVLLPTEGTTSFLLQAWAEKQRLDVSPIQADWVRLGRKAKAYRDSKICKEATHLVFFGGLRSDTYEKMAIRELKKGKRVFFYDAESKTFEELVT